MITPTMNFIVSGGKKLHGTAVVDASKNGAMGVLSASLLNTHPTIVHQMPKIEEVYRVLEVFSSLGTKVEWNESTLTLTPPEKYDFKNIKKESAEKTRSIVMCIGALAHHSESFSLPQSGGCRLGSRTVLPHFFALEKFGISIKEKENEWEISRKKLSPATIILAEASDTATINALITASRIPGKTTIKYASANYQVQEVCFFLQECGVAIYGIGTSTLVVEGVQEIHKPVEYTLSEDPIIAMFYLASAIITKSSITISRAPLDFLEQELLVLERMGFHYTLSEEYYSYNKKTRLVDIKTHPSTLNAPQDKIHSLPYPGLNPDNLPFFAVIATQAKGTTLIHDWMFEKRALYYTELDKLGAETRLADPHRIYIDGPTPLHSAELMSPPALRPAVILLIAMLGASKGKSILRNVYPINRGYEDIIGKLKKLGADVELEM
jgi:UDP-N-acetylglucosamine 1-carboxyvinyltransferase